MRVFGELRNWFLLALGAGTAGILAGWYFESDVMTMVIPLAAMALYLMPAYAGDRSLFSTYVFADSFYFLGFLFTMVSLGVSLLAFSQGGDGEISGAVNRFGVALATTIFGLGVRVYLVNFRPELDDSVAQAEKSLANASLGLRNQLDRLNADLVVQTDGWTTSLTHAITAANAELQAAYGSGGRAVKEAAEGFAKATTRETKSVEAAIGKLTAGVDSSSSTFASAVDALRTQIESFHLSEDTLTRSVQPALDKLANSLEKCGAALEAVRIDPSSATEALELLAVSARHSAKEATAFAEGLVSANAGGLSSAAAQYTAALTAASDVLRVQQAGLRAVEAGLLRDAQLTEEYRKKLQAEVDASRSAMAEVSQSMVDAARYVVTALRDED